MMPRNTKRAVTWWHHTVDDVRAATNGYIHRNIEIYIGQPSLQAVKTTRGPRVVRALCAQRDYNSHREAFGLPWVPETFLARFPANTENSRRTREKPLVPTAPLAPLCEELKGKCVAQKWLYLRSLLCYCHCIRRNVLCTGTSFSDFSKNSQYFLK